MQGYGGFYADPMYGSYMPMQPMVQPMAAPVAPMMTAPMMSAPMVQPAPMMPFDQGVGYYDVWEPVLMPHDNQMGQRSGPRPYDGSGRRSNGDRGYELNKCSEYYDRRLGSMSSEKSSKKPTVLVFESSRSRDRERDRDRDRYY